jgi:hypothetical protein
MATKTPADNSHIIRSDDGNFELWVGAVDDLWQMGRPVGRGGPWRDTSVTAGTASDPYLLRGYENRTLNLSHDSSQSVKFQVEVDIMGDGDWLRYQSFDVKPGAATKHQFPAAFSAYWLRVKADTACKATAELVYE